MEKRFLQRFFACFLGLTLLFAGLVWVVDPWYHFHGPLAGLPLCLRNGRYQNDGAARYLDYDTLLIGTSVTANMSTQDLDRCTGGKSQKLVVLGGYFVDFYGPLETALATHSVRDVYWGVDSNCFRRYDRERTWQEPSYLFDQNPFNDVQYLLNKEMVFQDLTEVLERAWKGERQDEVTGGYTWGVEEGRVWSRASALTAYNRPDVLPDQEPADAYLGAARDNLDKLLAQVDAHPDVTFHFYMAPYSILFWDYTIRKGQLEATFAMQQLVLEELTSRENVQVLYLMDDLDRITNLDLYCDHIHYSPEVCRELVEEIVTGTPMTREEVEPRLAAFRAFVTSYDYESLFS